MTLAVDVAVESGRIALSRACVTGIVRGVLAAELVKEALVSVTFLPRRRMAALNREHLGHEGATDVISFAFTPAGSRSPVIGDIYIAPEVARDNAREHGAPVREELARLIIHGTLHVTGHDHPHEAGARLRSRMWRRQEALLQRLFPGTEDR